MGQGFSALVVARGRVILFHRRGDAGDRGGARCGNREAYLVGQVIQPITAMILASTKGPRAAPAVAGDKDFTRSERRACCKLSISRLASASGVSIRNRSSACRKGFVGAACSPLVDDGRVLMNIGGPKWCRHRGVRCGHRQGTLDSATNDEAGYSAPVVATIGGVRHALFWTRAGLVDVDPATGKIRFQFPWRSRSHASVNAAAPLVAGDLVFLSASYGTGAILLQIAGSSVKQLWDSDDALSNHYATSVYRDGYVYGYHGRQEFGQSLRAIELKTGKVQWNVDRFGAGTVTLVGDKLLLIRENGELMVALAT